jgi:hypothetical protein
MKMRSIRLIVLAGFTLSFVLSGCGSTTTASEFGSGDLAQQLQGTWNSVCNPSGGTSEYDQHVFSGTSYNKYRYIFTSNTTCSGNPNTTSTLDSGTFSVEGNDATVANSFDTNIVEQSGTVYDLFSVVSGNTLQEGLKTVSQDETSQANRPTSLNSEIFTKM